MTLWADFDERDVFHLSSQWRVEVPYFVDSSGRRIRQLPGSCRRPLPSSLFRSSVRVRLFFLFVFFFLSPVVATYEVAGSWLRVLLRRRSSSVHLIIERMLDVLFLWPEWELLQKDTRKCGSKTLLRQSRISRTSCHLLVARYLSIHPVPWRFAFGVENDSRISRLRYLLVSSRLQYHFRSASILLVS